MGERVTHPRTPGSPAQLIHDFIVAAGGSRDLSLHLGVPAPYVSAWASADRPANRSPLSVERAFGLASDFPDAAAVLARAFAAMAGGRFEPGAATVDLAEAMLAAHRESGEAVGAAMAGKPAHEIQRECGEAIEALTTLRDAAGRQK